MSGYRIERLGHLGDGIAPGPVYAARTLPGEVVTGTLEGTRLTEVKVQEPSADRVAAPCPHYRACGGCQLQHASDDFVAAFKTGVVAEALNSHGIETDIRPILTSPPRSRRRATFSARRTKKGALAGFHAPQSDVIVAIPQCLLVTPALQAALPMVEALAVTGASRKGELSVTVTESDAGLDVSVTGGKPFDTPLQLALTEAAQQHDLARLTWDGEVVVTRRPPVQRIDGIEVVPPPGAFLQATKDGEETLQRLVAEAVGDAGPVLDLFCGIGTFALPLSRHVEVHAVEGLSEMTRALDHGWRHGQGLRRVTTEARDLFRNPLLPDELARFGAIVIDPPRAGAEAQVGQIARAAPDISCKIAHVSCNPVTIARDAARLIGAGWRLDWVQPVDQFRWSTHVELASQFTRS